MSIQEMFERQFFRASAQIINANSLRNMSTIVFGVGAIGSWISELLARVGIGFLTVWDFDQVSISNIPRSTYTAIDVGKPKQESAAEFIKSINPLCRVRSVGGDLLKARDGFITQLAREHDFCVIAADNFAAHDRINRLLYPVSDCVYTYVTQQGEISEIVRTTPGMPGCVRCLTNFNERMNAGVDTDFQSLGIDMFRVAVEATAVVLGVLLKGKKGGKRFSEYVNENSRLLLVLGTGSRGFKAVVPKGFVSGTVRVDTSNSWPDCPVCRKIQL